MRNRGYGIVVLVIYEQVLLVLSQSAQYLCVLMVYMPEMGLRTFRITESDAIWDKFCVTSNRRELQLLIILKSEVSRFRGRGPG